MTKLNFYSMFDVEAKDDESLLSLVADKLFEQGLVKATYKTALLERERTYPTGLETEGGGVSIPHVDPEHVNVNAVVTVVTRSPVIFHEMGGGLDDVVSVNCLFFILLSERGEQVKLLMNFMKIIQNSADMKKVIESHSQQAVAELLHSYLE